MIEGLVKSSLHTRLLVFILAVFVAAAGWYAYSNLTIEAFPDPTDTQVQVITLYHGQPTEEVERRVSIPLERALNGMPGLFRLRTISLFGLSFVTLTFEDGVEPLRRAPADHGAHPRRGAAGGRRARRSGRSPRRSARSIATRSTAPDADPMTLRTLQDWVVRPALLQVPGVADVVSYGGLVREIHVEPDPTKMAALGVVLDDLFKALSKAIGQRHAAATSSAAPRCSSSARLGMFKTLDDIGKVRVGFHGGVPVTVQRRRHGHRRLRPAPGRRHARRQRGRRRGHRAHAPRREPFGRAQGAAASGSTSSTSTRCRTASRTGC